MTDQNTDSARIALPSDLKAFPQSNSVIVAQVEQSQELKTWRRKCGCIRTSDKLKNILNTFPSAPPPSSLHASSYDQGCHFCAYSKKYGHSMDKYDQDRRCYLAVNSKSWQVIAELVQLVQLSVTATALALYYLIYCYMQLVYYTLRSALYFHNADGPMKITIGVVTVTSLIVGFNLMLRMERILGILY